MTSPSVRLALAITRTGHWMTAPHTRPRRAPAPRRRILRILGAVLRTAPSRPPDLGTGILRILRVVRGGLRRRGGRRRRRLAADLPPFPVDRLPGWLRTFVLAEAKATQTPPGPGGDARAGRRRRRRRRPGQGERDGRLDRVPEPLPGAGVGEREPVVAEDGSADPLPLGGRGAGQAHGGLGPAPGRASAANHARHRATIQRSPCSRARRRLAASARCALTRAAGTARGRPPPLGGHPLPSSGPPPCSRPSRPGQGAPSGASRRTAGRVAPTLSWPPLSEAPDLGTSAGETAARGPLLSHPPHAPPPTFSVAVRHPGTRTASIGGSGGRRCPSFGRQRVEAGPRGV